MKRIATAALLLLLAVVSTVYCQDNMLNEYINEGLSSNHALNQKKMDYSISLARLKESKALFFPDIDINARYTVAEGGRVIEFPVGDLLNPVYSTLNMLTGSAQFPTVENQSFNFYRPREHETKVSMIQPVFNSDIIYNYKINREYSEIARADIDLYKRELVKEIKTAYYNCCKALSLLELADSSIVLVNENLRVSRSLFNNDKVTIDVVYRSEAELAKAEAFRAKVLNMCESSGAYFNFLLNRPLETEFIPGETQEVLPADDLEQSQQDAIRNRNELQQLKNYMAAGEYAVRLEKGDRLPDLTAVVNYGYQGEEYRFTSDDDFVLASLVLQWNLFQGLQNKHTIARRKLELDKLRETYSEAEKSIKMEVLNSYYSLISTCEETKAARKQKLSAVKAYRVVSKKYEQGQANLLELIDARTTMTEAKSGLINSLNNYFISRAVFECARGDEFIQ